MAATRKRRRLLIGVSAGSLRPITSSVRHGRCFVDAPGTPRRLVSSTDWEHSRTSRLFTLMRPPKLKLGAGFEHVPSASIPLLMPRASL